VTRPVLIVFVLSFTLFGVSPALGCPSCFGDPDSSMTAGMNAGILLLLGVTGVVLAVFVTFFLYLRKRLVDVNRPIQNMLN